MKSGKVDINISTRYEGITAYGSSRSNRSYQIPFHASLRCFRLICCPLSPPFESRHAGASGAIPCAKACAIGMRCAHGLRLNFCHKELGMTRLESIPVDLQMLSVRLIQSRYGMRRESVRCLLSPCGRVDVSKERRRSFPVVVGPQ